MVECTGLENQRTAGYRGFESGNWWRLTLESLNGVLADLRAAGKRLRQLKAMAIDGTSGTLVCADRQGNPVGHAIMYNDARAAEEARTIRDESNNPAISSSWALPKALWIMRHDRTRFARTHKLLNQADWIAGKLCGSFETTDYSNGLKMGLDLETEDWPDWIDPAIHSRLPAVVAPGTPIGTVTQDASQKSGLPVGLTVVAGATDGVAACLASGLQEIGDYATSLGSTLTFKSLSEKLPEHPLVYAHKLPGGLWLPGAASNVGSRWIQVWFADQDIQALDRAAAPLLATSEAIYPLTTRGERFPFADDGFAAPVSSDLSGKHLFAAGLLGTACVERLQL